MRPQEGHRTGGQGTGKCEDFGAARTPSLKGKREEKEGPGEKGPDYRKLTSRVRSLGLIFLGQGL